MTKTQIERDVAAHFGRRYCVLTNRGTTALTAALHALDRPPGTKALFPAVMCSIPVFAARFAGWTPVFADVNLEDANFDRADVERVLKEGGVGAILPVHMFGKPDAMGALSELALRYGADLVEDAALSLGATREGRPVGSGGRISCLSFVRKMLPIEMGGAVLTDEEALARRAKAFVETLPPERSSQKEEVLAALRAFHAVTGYVAAGDWARKELLAPYEGEFRRLLLASIMESEWDGSVVMRELARLPEALQARRARAEVYENVLSRDPLRALDRAASSLFAYPVRLVGGAVEDFLAFSSDQGYNFKRIAYPDIHRVFGEARPLANAAVLEREGWGLTVDEGQSLSALYDDAGDVRSMLEAYQRVAPNRPVPDLRGKLELRMAGAS